MWLAVAIAAVVLGVVLAGGGIVGGRRDLDTAGALFVVGVAVLGVGTIALALSML